MGGCVASVMERKNDSSLVPYEMILDRLAYGELNVKISDDGPNESGVYRRAKITDEEHRYFFHEWIKEPNALQILQKNCSERKDRHALAYRKVEKVVKEKTAVRDDKGNEVEKFFEYTHLCDPTYITYKELWELLTSFGRGVAAVSEGMEARSSPGGSPRRSIKRVALYEETRWEWLVSMFGLWTQEMVGVTVYANLGVDALIYALKEAECEAIILNGSAVKRLLDLCEKNGIADAVFIYLDELPGDVDAKGHTLISWNDVLEKGRVKAAAYEEQIQKQEAKDSTADADLIRRYSVKVTSDPDTEVLIMYTSGTTGNPKGVIHSIGAITQGSKGLQTMLTELIGGEADGETYVCYLPAAHIFEFICEVIFLSRGILLCFGTPRTLTDVFARPCGDITMYKPFALMGVPRIFDTIKKTVESKLPPVGSVKRSIFDRAYESRLAALKRGQDTPFWNEKVFKTTRQLMGNGTMRGICSGGAPLADKTQEWINVVLGVPVAQGYGMTETVCNASVQRIGELHCRAGQLLRGVEAKLLDTEDYKHTDKPNPRGELCLRGNFMFKGYYKQPELTKEVLQEDGWIRTGDVAEIDLADNNNIRIVGRVKALAKNALGEYIAMETLEALYGSHAVVTPNGVCVCVDSNKPYITALILTDEAKAMKFAKDKNIAGSWPDILSSDAFNDAVAADMAKLALKEGRMKFECVQKVRVLADEWTPENGLVTASLKVRRSVVEKHYADTIAELFKD